MNTTNGITKSTSTWKPRFLEDMNQYTCLDCDRFYEVGGSNAFRLEPISKKSTSSQKRAIGIANPEQCADCVVCTENYAEQLSHYSFCV